MPIITTVPTEQGFSHQWRTSIQKGIKGTEKRSALFTWPRLSLSNKFILPTYTQYSWMKRNLYRYIHDLWEIPIWYDKTILTSEAAAGQAILEVEDPTDRHFYDGRDCIIINDSSYEKGTISVVGADSNPQIVLSCNLTDTWPSGSLVLPLYKFRIQPTQEIRGIQENPVQTISFDATEEYETLRSFSYSSPSSGLDTYLDYGLFLTPPKHAISSYSSHPYEMLQMLGLGYEMSHYDETELGLKLSYVLTNREDTWNFLKMFDSKRGRFSAFWIPSWNKDIVVTGAISAADTILVVEDLDYDDYYLANDVINRYVWFRFPDKTYACRKIIGAAGVHIELDAAIGKDVAAGDLSSMLNSFLIFSRFDIDEISFVYSTSGYNSTKTNLKTKGLVEESL
jgi:hypothetical protein